MQAKLCGHKVIYDMIRNEQSHKARDMTYGYYRCDGIEAVTLSAICASINYETDLVKKPVLILNMIWAALVFHLKRIH
jgi:hypothetical protein